MPSLSQPVRVHNLTAWFIFAPPAAVSSARDYAVLEETIATETAVLHETGNVDLFIQAGDIVKGGRQDRTIGADFIVPARSGKIPLPASCVERSRWHRRHKESDKLFSTAKDFLASKKARLALRFSKSQSEVWDRITEEQEQLVKAVQQEVSDAESPTSLQLTYESEGVTDAVEDYAAVLDKALPETSGSAVGVVWAINGVLSHADHYASPHLFAKLWRKLLRAAATEAIGQREQRDQASGAATEPPSIEPIREWLERIRLPWNAGSGAAKVSSPGRGYAPGFTSVRRPPRLLHQAAISPLHQRQMRSRQPRVHSIDARGGGTASAPHAASHHRFEAFDTSLDAATPLYVTVLAE